MNEAARHPVEEFGYFDYEDIRYLAGWVDPDLCESGSVVSTVAGHFLQWLAVGDRARACKRSAFGIPEQMVAV